MKVVRFILLLVMLGGLFGTGHVHSAVAQVQAGAITLKVTPVFDGYFKNGEWLAVWAEIENSGKSVDGQLAVQITSSATQSTYAVAVALPLGARKRVPLYLLANNYSRELEIQLNGPAGVLATQKIPVRPQANLTFMVGLVARERGGLALLNGVTLPGQERPKVIVDVTMEDLPDRMEGLRSFDVLVFNDVDTSRLTPGQATALADWVQQGGRLVIGGGGTGVTLAGLPAGLLPVTVTGQTNLQAEDLTALVDFAGGSAIRTSGSFIGSKITPSDSSSLLAGDLRLPLVVEGRYGEGQVDYVALNLSSAPFNSWPDTIRFWNQLLGPTGEYSQNLPADISLRALNNMEMVGNLSNIPALDLPSIQWLSLLLAVYILLVGPINYFVLRRLRRLQLAWLTIPALTLVFSAGAFGIGSLLHGTDVILNQIALISPNGSGAAAVTNYLGLFSPSQRSYSLDVQTPGLLSPIVGNDGNGWGPVGPQSSGSNVTFVQGDQPRVSGLAINQWSFQAFSEEERWNQFGNLRADLRLENEKVLGTVFNDTRVALTDVSLVVGSSFVRLGDLAAGAQKPVELILANQAPDRTGMPLSYLLYENSGVVNSAGGSRLIDLKRSLVSRVLDGSGSKFSAFRSTTPTARSASQSNGFPMGTLLAWTDQVPPEVTVEGTQIKKQVIGLVTQKMELKISALDVVTIPTGMIPGGMTLAPTNGGMCGSGNMTGVVIENGSAEFKYQLPILNGYRVMELRLLLSGDGPQPDLAGIALYHWAEKTWTMLKDPLMGIQTIEQPERYIDGSRSVRVRLTGNAASKGFCTYIDLGLKAEKTAQSGGPDVSR